MLEIKTLLFVELFFKKKLSLIFLLYFQIHFVFLLKCKLSSPFTNVPMAQTDLLFQNLTSVSRFPEELKKNFSIQVLKILVFDQ